MVTKNPTWKINRLHEISHDNINKKVCLHEKIICLHENRRKHEFKYIKFEVTSEFTQWYHEIFHGIISKILTIMKISGNMNLTNMRLCGNMKFHVCYLLNFGDFMFVT